MAVVDGGAVSIAYQNEATFGTDPAGTPVLWRVTEKNINEERATLESREIGTGGQQSAGVHGRSTRPGQFGGELGKSIHDHALPWMLNAPAAWVADATGTGDHIDVTDAKRGLTVHKLYGAVANKYRKFTGVACSSFRLRADPETQPVIEFGVLALGGGALTTGNPTTSAAPTDDSYGPFQGDIDLDVGGTPVNNWGFVTSIELSGEWNYNTSNVLFSRDPVNVARGNLVLTGSIQAYFDTVDGPTIFGYGETEQSVGVQFQFQTSATVFHRFFLPRVKFWPATDNPGQQGDFPVTMNFRCSKGEVNSLGGGASTTALMRIQRDYGV